MADLKTPLSYASTPNATDNDALDPSVAGFTSQDAADMARLGKAQQFHRNFSYWSTFGFVSIYMATWEFTIVSMTPAIPAVGFGGFFWTFMGCMVCYGAVVASLAEMSSMSPTAGGQYHWVSEFAPPRFQKEMSYAAGWMSSLGWIASLAGGTYACADLVQVAVNLVWTEFVMTAWQLFLIILAMLLITIVLNTMGAKILPALEVASLVGHTLGFVVFVGVLWGMCRPLNSGREVFLGFENNSGWENYGAACLVTQVSIIWSMLGSDTIVHISEEVRDASIIVPQAMWWSYALNSVMAFVMLITVLFCIGPLDSILEADLPYLNLFSNTGSGSAALFLAIVLILLVYAGNITALATTSREVWAFARDKGFPCSNWIAHMHRKYDMPFNAVYLSTIISIILSLISLGSSLAFNIILSLSLLALMSTYSLSIGCVLLRRIQGPELPHARWSLGRWGLPINLLAVVYSAFIVLMSCFPSEVSPAPVDANWAPVIWVAVILLSVVAYVCHGRKHFTPPVMFIEGKRAVGVGLQKVD
ncbi:polyamine transporter tpo5 [Gnomoniopsis smithogilvyi]|uniref:Polyamine transporter tpo5 n=1 Tax=Gnomoniopsis smithogilvyi TaxID=1191159 RepID=A0A9W8YKV7_9PEZI|nr:polyamine transporter tpo5 [Gnomoniopsis smithogilvyi]